MSRVVVAHVHFTEIWPELVKYIENIQPDRLLLSYTGKQCPALEAFGLQSSQVSILNVENRGRDTWPLVAWAKLGAFASPGDLVWKIGTKRSSHILAGARWRRELLDAIAGSRQTVDSIHKQLESSPELDLLGASKHLRRVTAAMAEEHQHLFEDWSQACGIKRNPIGVPYIAGTMFVARARVLDQLARLPLNDSDFVLEAADPFSRSFAIQLFVLNTLKVPGSARARTRLDSRTRPASPATYALEPFIAFAAKQVEGV